VIGEAHPRLGGDRFVAGTGRFVDDVQAPGMLHAAVLRSPHAHARLVSIDTKRARDLPGVHAVLTAADVPATAIIPNRVPAPKGTDRYLQPAIARDVVRFVGEPVALVVADDPYIAGCVCLDHRSPRRRRRATLSVHRLEQRRDHHDARRRR
jgi:CO/xanthine dehydrogenase Mo-binding subunit